MRSSAVCRTVIILSLTIRAQAADTGLLPAILYENQSATDPAVRFVLQSGALQAYFASTEIRLRTHAADVRLRFEGAISAVAIHSLDPAPGRVNFIKGQNPALWKNLQPYTGLVYRDLYPGIDMIWRVRGSGVKTEFVVAPGADANVIRMLYAGVKNIRVDSSGSLVLTAGDSEIRDEAPDVYIERGGIRTSLRASYRVTSEGVVGFNVDPYDPTATLVIDPVLSFSTFLAGSGHDSATAAATDSNGNAYVAGWTESVDFPVTGGLARGRGVDMWVAKFTAGNTLSYCTFIGGSGDDRAAGIVVDSGGNAIIAGSTSSPDMPLYSPIQNTLHGSSDAFIAKLNPFGTGLLFATYYGGSAADAAVGVARDSANNMYVVGNTSSTDFPTVNAFQRANNGQQNVFVLKISPTGGTLYFSTLLGGSNIDIASGIAVDSSGAAYITGGTQSYNFPLLNAIQSTNRGQETAFVTKLSSAGNALVYSTLLGGSGGTFITPEMGTGIAVDSSGAAYLTGVTSSSDFPVVNAYQSAYGGSTDSFVVKINPAGNALVYSTYFGGSSKDWATGITVDRSGTVYVCGYTSSDDLPLVQPVQGSNAGIYDGFVAHLDSSGNLTSSTYLGGNMIDAANAIAVDNVGNVLVAGQTQSLNFPLMNALFSVNLGQYSAFVAKFFMPNPMGFFPLAACRIVDSRASQGKSGAFGPPKLGANSGRDFPLLSGSCGISNAAQVYSLNVTAVPPAALSFLSAWPAGQPFPNVSTLNSPDASTIANAAILPAGNNGAVTLMAGNATDVIIDTNGYFAPPNGQELAFYPITPCRVADTRGGQGKSGAFGPPGLTAFASRDFPISSGACSIPASAKAYSLNMTAVPQGHLDFLSAWPAGQPYPGVSTLNSPDGTTIANAAIIPAGTNGAITVLTGNPTNLIIDVNGYFASPGSPGALHFYPLTPCRVADTRAGQGRSGAFGPPSLASYASRDFPLLSGGCSIPSAAQAYALNITAVPLGHLDFLSAWPAGQAFPGVSTLGSPKGTIIASASIVPAGTSGAITILAANPTDLIIDINGYFAP